MIIHETDWRFTSVVTKQQINFVAVEKIESIKLNQVTEHLYSNNSEPVLL